jgi:hypothetical protein
MHHIGIREVRGSAELQGDLRFQGLLSIIEYFTLAFHSVRINGRAWRANLILY